VPKTDGAAAAFAAHKKKIMDAGGFSISINDVATGQYNMAVIDYDTSFHVETYTFEMARHSHFDP